MKKITDKKIRILAEAVKIFARDGFEKTSVDEICINANVAKGTLYYHFKNKEYLFKSIIDEGKTKFDKLIIKETQSIENPIEQLKIVIKTEEEFIRQYREFFIIFISQILKTGERFNVIEKIVLKGVELGMITKKVSEVEIASSLFWSVAMTTLNRHCKNQSELFLNGICAKK